MFSADGENSAFSGGRLILSAFSYYIIKEIVIMISDRLYELAFEYKKTKLWKHLWDTHLFAVKLSDGEIGYISIMGAAGEYCALGLYIGEKGLNSLRILMKGEEETSSFEVHETFFQQDCLQCAFECKEMLLDEEIKEIRNYARMHQIRLSGKNAYPHFIKCKPNFYPWRLQTDKEQELICEALMAAIEMSKLLSVKSKKELGLEEFNENSEDILMLELKNGEYVLKKEKAHKYIKPGMPRPKMSNDIYVMRLKKLKRKDILECELIRSIEPIQDKPDDIPSFPIILFAVSALTGYIMQIDPVINYEENPEELLNFFIEALLKENFCPLKIKVRDERTYEFIKDFCGRLNIELVTDENMPALDDFENDFFNNFSFNNDYALDNFIDAINNIFDLNILDMKDIPEAIADELSLMLNEGIFPEDLEKKIKKVLKPKTEITNQNFKRGKRNVINIKKADGSFVISVSLGTGCYRHIQISGNSMLFNLHLAILSAFGFDDDHAHAFFMDNEIWSNYDCYYAPEVSEGEHITTEYTLNQAGLYKGKKFKYVFDFGEEWVFQCGVLRVIEEKTDKPIIIRSKGRAPKQYY